MRRSQHFGEGSQLHRTSSYLRLVTVRAIIGWVQNVRGIGVGRRRQSTSSTQDGGFGPDSRHQHNNDGITHGWIAFDNRSFDQILSDWQDATAPGDPDAFIRDQLGLDGHLARDDLVALMAGHAAPSRELILLASSLIPESVAISQVFRRRGEAALMRARDQGEPIITVPKQGAEAARLHHLRKIRDRQTPEGAVTSRPFIELLLSKLQERAGEPLDSKTTLSNLAVYLNVDPAVLQGEGFLSSEAASHVAEQLASLLELEDAPFDQFVALAIPALSDPNTNAQPNPFGRAVRFLRHAAGLTQSECDARQGARHRLLRVAEHGYVLNDKAIDQLAAILGLTPRERESLSTLAQAARGSGNSKTHVEAMTRHFAGDGLTASDYIDAVSRFPTLLTQRPATLISNVESFVTFFAKDGLTNRDYLKAACAAPTLFARRPEALIGNVEQVVGRFSKDGLTAKGYLSAAVKLPPLFSLHPNRVIGHVDQFVAHFAPDGLTIPAFLDAAIRQPPLLTLQPETMTRNIERVVSHFAPYGLTRRDYLQAALERPTLFWLRPETVIANIEAVVHHFADDGLTAENYLKSARRQSSLFYQRPKTVIENIEQVVRQFSADGLTTRAYLHAACSSPSHFVQRPQTIVGHLHLLTRFFEQPQIKAALPAPPAGMSHAVAFALQNSPILGLADENLILRDLHARLTQHRTPPKKQLKSPRSAMESSFAMALGHDDLRKPVPKVSDQPGQDIGPHARNVLLRAMIRAGFMSSGKCRDD